MSDTDDKYSRKSGSRPKDGLTKSGSSRYNRDSSDNDDDSNTKNSQKSTIPSSSYDRRLSSRSSIKDPDESDDNGKSFNTKGRDTKYGRHDTPEIDRSSIESRPTYTKNYPQRLPSEEVFEHRGRVDSMSPPRNRRKPSPAPSVDENSHRSLRGTKPKSPDTSRFSTQSASKDSFRHRVDSTSPSRNRRKSSSSPVNENPHRSLRGTKPKSPDTNRFSTQSKSKQTFRDRVDSTSPSRNRRKSSSSPVNENSYRSLRGAKSRSPDTSRFSTHSTSKQTFRDRVDSTSPPRNSRKSSSSPVNENSYRSRRGAKSKSPDTNRSWARSSSPQEYQSSSKSDSRYRKNHSKSPEQFPKSSNRMRDKTNTYDEPYSTESKSSSHSNVVKSNRSYNFPKTSLRENDEYHQSHSTSDYDDKTQTTQGRYKHRTSLRTMSPDDDDRSSSHSLVSKSSMNYPTNKYKSNAELLYPDTDTTSSLPHQRTSHRSIDDRPRERRRSPSLSTENSDNFNSPHIAYVPDLPPTTEDNRKMEKNIRQCLEQRHRQEVRDIKCFIELGLGIVYLHNREDKKNLIHVIGKILIDPSNDLTISFVNEIDLTSYVVINTTEMKNLPSTDDIAQKWKKLYKTRRTPNCESVSIQFPNIFRVSTNSLDELLEALSIRDFSINGHLATVHFRGDCCFFEDLPRTTTVERLREAIGKQISDRYTSKELMHIQYNKEGANAVMITSGKARIASLHKSIDLDGRVLMKKDSLTCRLLIRDIPSNISVSRICDHELFRNSVTKTLQNGDHMIIEVSNVDVYRKCVDGGVLRISGQLLPIDSYLHSVSTNNEIDAETWYETEMYDITKPDIMQFVSNPQHDIFRLKWNPEAFLKEFTRWKSTDRHERDKGQDKHEKQCNLRRHALRMTVMLNTIGVVRRGFYRIGDKEVKLKLDRLKTIVYDQKSKLKRGRTISLDEATATPYPSTIVKVVNEDCLDVYKTLVGEGRRPVLLNMANENDAGGGYKRGDGAQEETLFRRSNYYQSLDMTMDDGKPSARFYCNSRSELDELSKRDRFYPMHEFGGIYTSGLNVFRLSEEKGYRYMDIPMYDVCSIAMAAYRDPQMEKKDLLAPKYSIGTRKKIENIFAIAYQHKHDCLVLSALGCGAFRNPPTHVANIFKSVIEQYAGYFKSIYFSIIDDHNAKQDFNRHGNYQPFHQLLNNFDAMPKRHRTVDMMIGPWRIVDQPTNKEIVLSDIRICYASPCRDGGKCTKMQDEQHCREYSHPPLCPNATGSTSCKEKNDDQHLLWFRHRQKCRYGGECELVDTNVSHANEYEHPDYCRDRGRCDKMDEDHLKLYRHLPLCRYALQCIDFNRRSAEHCDKFRHCVPNCRFGHFCVRFHDEEHMREERHPFKEACPFTPFHCHHHTQLSQSTNIKTLPVETQNHCLKYSHVCRFGRQCHEKNEVHWSSTIHVAREICRYGIDCRKLHEEEHLNSFSHQGIEDIRRLCDNPSYLCKENGKPDHIRRCRHQGNYDRSGVIRCFEHNKDIDFMGNQENTIKRIKEHTKSWTPPSAGSLADIQKLVKGFQPVHRCNKLIFESILLHGHVMSRGHMEHLKKASSVAEAVQEHEEVRAILDRIPRATVDGPIKEFILAIVRGVYSKKYAGGTAVTTGGTPSVSDSTDDHEGTRRRHERLSKGIMEPEELNTIEKCARDIAEASWNLHNSPAGIGYAPDKVLGTDKHVFSVLGPNLGHYYGDIFLVFKPEVMLHPDANFSPQAGTSFNSGRTFSHRAWIKDPTAPVDRVKCFHESKLHVSMPGYEYAAALELIAVTGVTKTSMDVNVRDVFDRWQKVDSHQVFEAHLPQLIPLDYVEEIYIAKNLFASLSEAAQKSTKKIFGDSLHITEHDINLTDTSGSGTHPTDKSRADYQDYVTKELIEKFEKQAGRVRNVGGIAITLAPSQFSDQIVLPLTISDAYKHYHHTHKHGSNSDSTYIYWQTMGGDMMMTLSKEQIDFERDQKDLRCLVCYIAEQPSTRTEKYNEDYSYLNAGDPFRHAVIMRDGRCSQKSQTFYRGCNLDDWMMFCLKLQKKTGEVTLSHAGSNGIYCQEKISCSFGKETLDLHQLKYIHVSARSQKLPIRKLVVAFEPIVDFHPTFDKNFQPTEHNPGIDIHPSNMIERRSGFKDSPQSPAYVGNKIRDDPHNSIGHRHKLRPCPESVNCLLQNSRKHMDEYSHPCPYSELCYKKDDEPHLTHERHRAEPCSSRSACQRLDDPFHRAKFRHEGYPDFLIPCRDGGDCKNRSRDHRIQYSHGEQIKMTYEQRPERTSDASLTRKFSSSDEEDKFNSPRGHTKTPGWDRADCSDHKDSLLSLKQGLQSFTTLIPCRHGSDCWYQNDSEHCSKFSHPPKKTPLRIPTSIRTLIPCRHGSDCRDQNDSEHCSKFSHPPNKASIRTAISIPTVIPCRHGSNCRDQHDSQHCSKYSHPLTRPQ